MVNRAINLENNYRMRRTTLETKVVVPVVCNNVTPMVCNSAQAMEPSFGEEATYDETGLPVPALVMAYQGQQPWRAQPPQQYQPLGPPHPPAIVEPPGPADNRT